MTVFSHAFRVIAANAVVGAVALVAVTGGAAAHDAAYKAAKAKPQADLIIRSVNLHATGTCNRLRPAIVGDVVIKNRGTARAKPLLVSPLIQALDVRNERFKDDDIKVNSIAPGEEVRTRIRIGVGRDKSTYRGTRIIRIKADPRGKIAERNELNNTFSVRVKAHHCS